MFLFNYTSIKKQLTNLDYVKFNILLSLLVVGYFRALYFIGVYTATKEIKHLVIAMLGITITTLLIIYIFKNPKKTSNILHFGVWVTFLGMLYRIFFVHEFLIIQIQTIFLIIMWSFYGLGKNWGILYSIAYIFIIPLHVFRNGYDFALFPASDDYNYYFTWVIFVYNIIMIIYVPYKYQDAIRSVLEKKAHLTRNLEYSIETNKEFTSVITHELRTPLNSVIGLANLLKEKSTNLEEKEELIALEESANYLMDFVNKTLEFNKLTLNMLKTEYATIDIPVLINSFIKHNKQKIKDKSLHIERVIDSILSYKLIMTDPMRATITIRNLMEYLFRISPQHSTISLQIQLTKTLESLGHQFVFSINNPSVVLNKFEMKNLFEPFIKSNDKLDENIGLELSIAKKSLENLGYNLDVYNSPQTGIKFQFTLPVTLEEKMDIIESVPAPSAPMDFSPLQVLVVDDNPINLIVMKNLLKHLDIVPIVISDGMEAIEIVKKQHIDMILMDLHMPIISGFETSERIRSLGSTISQPYIIAISAVNREDVNQDLITYGINDFLPKPVDKEMLQDILSKYNKESIL